MADRAEIISRVKDTIEQMENGDFTIYFFVVDGRNVPNGTLAYIYDLAKTIKDLGYNVKMAYQLPNEYTATELHRIKKKGKHIDPSRIFEGVGEWLGEEYASIEHVNTAPGNWSLGPCDILFIPEALTSLMQLTYKKHVASERIVVLSSYDNVMDFIPAGMEWANFGIADVVSPSQKQVDLLQKVFPYIRPTILPPRIHDCFRKPLKPQKLIVNIVSKSQRDVNKVIKPFFLRYPVYKFIAFRDLRGFPREKFAEMLQEGAITIWMDDSTPFGYSALEAMRCGNIVIGKIPDEIPDWMSDGDGGVRSCAFWTYDINTIPDILSQVIATWMRDKMPEELISERDSLPNEYTTAHWESNVKEYIEHIVATMKQRFKYVLAHEETLADSQQSEDNIPKENEE
ncbi:MAG: hypothetical protein LUD72_00075 [Bacteroidales bacterium]|nr:hypothetical protein [Bacteroidales bacterium]